MNEKSIINDHGCTVADSCTCRCETDILSKNCVCTAKKRLDTVVEFQAGDLETWHYVVTVGDSKCTTIRGKSWPCCSSPWASIIGIVYLAGCSGICSCGNPFISVIGNRICVACKWCGDGIGPEGTIIGKLNAIRTSGIGASCVEDLTGPDHICTKSTKSGGSRAIGPGQAICAQFNTRIECCCGTSGDPYTTVPG